MVQSESKSISPSLPFIVGVTGHRDIPPVFFASLETTIRKILQELRRKHPFTPIIILSPLAEGADRLVAKVGLELGCRLRVPLPHPDKHYLNDFETEESKAEFKALILKAESSFVVGPNFPSLPPIDSRQTSEQDLGYARVGLYVAINSHLLLALWDGIEDKEPKPGGTFQVFNYRLNGSHSLIPLHEDNAASIETGWVIHIQTPRVSTAGSSTGSTWLMRGRENLELFSETSPKWLRFSKGMLTSKLQSLNCLEILNKDLATNVQAQTKIDDSLLEFPTEAEFKNGVFSDPAVQWFARIDRLAILYQRLYFLELKWVYGCALGAFSLVNIYSNLYPTQSILGGFFIALTLLAGIFKFLRHFDHHRKYLDYRALAEGFRVQAFWNLADIQEEAATHYLSHQVGELDWIRLAMRSIHIPNQASEIPRSNVNWQEIKKHWLTNQKDYQFRLALKSKLAGKKIQILSIAGFVAAMVMTGILFLFHDYLAQSVRSWTVAGIGFFTALSAVVAAYGQKRAFPELSRRAHGMVDMLSWWIKKIESAENWNQPEKIKNLFIDIGCAALQENGDWVLLYRTRDLEMPKG